MQCSAVQCSAVQCSAVQCSAVQCSAVQCSAVQCSASQTGSTCICHDILSCIHTWWVVGNSQQLVEASTRRSSTGHYALSNSSSRTGAFCRLTPRAACLISCALRTLKKSCSGWGNGFVGLLFSSKHAKSCSINTCNCRTPLLRTSQGSSSHGLQLLIWIFLVSQIRQKPLDTRPISAMQTYSPCHERQTLRNNQWRHGSPLVLSGPWSWCRAHKSTSRYDLGQKQSTDVAGQSPESSVGHW